LCNFRAKSKCRFEVRAFAFYQLEEVNVDKERGFLPQESIFLYVKKTRERSAELINFASEPSESCTTFEKRYILPFSFIKMKGMMNQVFYFILSIMSLEFFVVSFIVSFF